MSTLMSILHADYNVKSQSYKFLMLSNYTYLIVYIDQRNSK